MPWNQSLSEFDSTATTEEEQQTPETTPRAWWLTAKERTVYRRMSSPFDGTEVLVAAGVGRWD
jgi:hypothetical protein